MVNWWQGEAILRALGVVPVYPENYSVACAVREAASPFIDHCVADGFPTTLCGYAKSCLGYARRAREYGGIPPDAPVGGMPPPAVLIGSGTACDARFKWFQALGRYLDAPVWVLELPHPGVRERFLEGVVEYEVKYMVEESREFIAFLERLLGRKMDWDRLEELVDTSLKTLRVWHQVDLLRRAVPSPMDSRDFYACMVPGFYLATEKESLEFYQQLYEEVSYRVREGIGVIPEEKYRLIFAEIPPWHSMDFLDYFARYGGVFAVESRGYHPPPPLEILEEVSDPLERISWNTYWWRTFSFPQAERSGQTVATTQIYLDWAKEYRIDGAVLHSLLSCRTGSFPLMHLRNMLLKQVKVPSLVLQGDIVDLRVFNRAQAEREAEAFIEILDHYKRVREREGLEW
jgi:benzoyl-CoA reductase/2-hydroxyglutaryl-CoA dehydratase subunit BcrC/BadD/HgdB